MAAIRGRSAILFMDPFGLDVEMEDISEFIREIGPEARSDPPFASPRGPTTGRAKAGEDAKRAIAAVSGHDIGMPWRHYYARLNAFFGGTWWKELWSTDTCPPFSRPLGRRQLTQLPSRSHPRSS